MQEIYDAASHEMDRIGMIAGAIAFSEIMIGILTFLFAGFLSKIVLLKWIPKE